MEVQINKDMTATIKLYEYTNKIHNLFFFSQQIDVCIEIILYLDLILWQKNVLYPWYSY